jgi:hypothetical protein
LTLSNSVGFDGRVKESVRRNKLKESYIQIESYEKNLLLSIIKNEEKIQKIKLDELKAVYK